MDVKRIYKATIATLPLPAFDYSAMLISADKCLSGAGSINGINVNYLQGPASNHSYQWTDANNNVIGNTAAIKNLLPGTYILKVTDGVFCTVSSNPVVVENVNETLASPVYADVTILKNTTATFKVNNVQQNGSYELFEDPASTPIASNLSGIFTTPILSADKTYYIRFINGICSSAFIPVKVTVVEKTIVNVPTAFTPNRDGKNDVLKAVPYGVVKLHHFTIYNRWGQIIFSSNNFNNGWDGTLRGAMAESGVYVWIIKATDELTGQTIEQRGAVTIIR
jgi:gliding motility-associated-like protein